MSTLAAVASPLPEKPLSRRSPTKKRRPRPLVPIRRAGDAASPVANRRRSNSSGKRAEATVMSFAKWLSPDDAALVHCLYHSKQPTAQLARARHQPIWSLQRHLRRLITRILSAEFAFVAGKLESAPSFPAWPPHKQDYNFSARLHLAIIRAVFIDGLTMRQAARDSGLSLHLIRRHCDLLLLDLASSSKAQA